MATGAKGGFGAYLGIRGITPATGGIDTVSIGAGGTGYSVNDVLTVGQGTGGTLLVTTVAAGVVTAVRRLMPGSAYTVANGKTTTVSPPGGTGCTINVLTLLLQVAELQAINWAGHKVNLDDATNMDSPDAYEEEIAGTVSGGNYAIEGNYTNEAGQAQLQIDHDAETPRVFVIVLPLAVPQSWTATCYIETLEQNAKYDEKLGFKGTLRVTGKPVVV